MSIKAKKKTDESFLFEGLYDPQKIAIGLYDKWINANLFKPSTNKENFSIVMAPPNLTGVLHLGHSWELSLSDLFLRYKRLQGFNVSWVPGYDHAGIATQTKYEKILDANSKKDYMKLDRRTKVAAIMKWALSQGEIINSQVKLLGASVDWSNHHFTLDDHSNKAVVFAFKKLYDAKLIYQAKALVNWDVKLQTAISNIEVINKPVQQYLYYVAYSVENSQDKLIVATSRPETIFADAALFVNPKDKRYKKFVGKNVYNPLTNVLMPVMQDSYVELDFGSGVLKCTPAHDFNDYKLGKKYQLPEFSCFNLDGTLNEIAQEFKSLDRLSARPKVVEKLKASGHLIKVENLTSNVGFSERSGAVVEPMLSTQWFVDLPKIVPQLKKAILDKKELSVFPKRFINLLTHWLDETNEWCISRQLVWGHQIPVWYHKKTKEIYVDVNPPKDLVNYYQDPDVLDTWFSSSLWPLICFDWPNQTKEFKNGYPNNLMVMGFDIIFFWGIRMLFQGFFHTKQLPFKHLLVHGLIRDAKGVKMSKSVGNVIDPIPLIEKYGSDALRICLTANTTPGEDTNFQMERLNDASNFLNKLWNASKYVLSLNCEFNSYQSSSKHSLADTWIIERCFAIAKKVASLLDRYDFTLANKYVYDFIWNDFCNTYLELSKPTLKTQHAPHTVKVLRDVLEQICIILHPFAPFLSERIFQALRQNENVFVLQQKWPKKSRGNSQSQKFDTVVELIQLLRKFKAQANLSNKYLLKISLVSSKKEVLQIVKQASPYFDAINCQFVSFVSELPKNAKQVLTIGDGYLVIHDEKLNQAANASLEKKIAFLKAEVQRSRTILSNNNFIKNAPPQKVKQEQEKLAKYEAELETALKNK